jgi:hypothetical protein
VADPDLWWPYQWGEAKLYRLKLEFRVGERDRISDSQTIDFGIRKITQGRDSDKTFPEIGEVDENTMWTRFLYFAKPIVAARAAINIKYFM